METITGKFHQYPLRNVGGVEEIRIVDKWLKLTKGHNSGKKQSSVTSVQYDPLQVMATITGRFHYNPLRTARGVAETRLTVEKLPKGYNSGKNQSSKTSIKYDLQVMGTRTGRFHQNPLKTVGGVAETRMCLWTDGPANGRTHYYSPLQLTSGDKYQQARHSNGYPQYSFL